MFPISYDTLSVWGQEPVRKLDESESGPMVLEKVSRIHLHIRGVDVKLETVENRQVQRARRRFSVTSLEVMFESL